MRQRTVSGDSAMFPVKTVTRLTGLNPETVRKWEERHNAITPERTQGGSRRYSTRDIKRLSLLHQLTKAGYSIGSIASMEDASLQKLLARVHDAANIPAGREQGVETEAPNGFLEAYLDAVRGFDAQKASVLLARAAAVSRPVDFALQVVQPMVDRVGLLWQQSRLSVAHEHMITSQLRGVFSLMLNFSVPHPKGPRVVLATPEGHLHELGILIAAVMAAQHGAHVVYLGASVPTADLELALRQGRAEVCITGIARDVGEEELPHLLASLHQVAKTCPLWLGLPRQHALRHQLGFARLFFTFQELDEALASMISPL